LLIYKVKAWDVKVVLVSDLPYLLEGHHIYSDSIIDTTKKKNFEIGEFTLQTLDVNVQDNWLF
jgi:hypothetical protein